MEKLVGNQLKILKIIHKNSKNSNSVKLDVVFDKFSNAVQTHQEIDYLHSLGLISKQYGRVSLTPKGRSYFKARRYFWFETIITSVVFPLVVAFVTALVTTLLTLWLSN